MAIFNTSLLCGGFYVPPVEVVPEMGQMFFVFFFVTKLNFVRRCKRASSVMFLHIFHLFLLVLHSKQNKIYKLFNF